MGITEGLTVLAVIGGFVYIIFAQLTKKNPHALDNMKKYFEKKPKPEEELGERMEQIYLEKRFGL